MNKKKILIIVLSIVIVLILGVVLLLIFNKESLTNKLIVNDINDVSTTKKLDISILEIKKTDFGYNVKLKIKNNGNKINIKFLKLSLKDSNNKEIAQLYFNVNEIIPSNDEYVSELLTEDDLSNTKIIDYELVD